MYLQNCLKMKSKHLVILYIAIKFVTFLVFFKQKEES